ncbi:MAG TPA: PTS sugar transporter subunit IIA [Myxococcaceae bacterium]|nr:PTS sugar transporter subunit IIA [Myxococcaceae bacterium]
MKIIEFLSPDAVIAQLSARSKPELLQEMGRLIARAHPPADPARLVEVLEERERLGSTGIGEGVAIPHGKLAGLPGLVAAFGVSKGGLDFNAVDGKPTYLFFTLVAPENSAGMHVKALALIARLFRNPRLREAVLRAESAEAIYQLISQEDAKA